MKKLWVTGARGFVGRTLLALASAPDAPQPFTRWEIIPASPDMDLRHPETIKAEIERVRPDAVLHLAAQSFVPESFRDPVATFDTNFLGTYHLLAMLKASGFVGRMLYVSSGDVYGWVPEDRLPIQETCLPEPRSPYSVSKIAAETLCGQWTRSEGADILIARPFNHIGPGQDKRFAISDFAAQIVEIRRGLRPAMLTVGDIDVTRDFLSVRDVLRAYVMLLEHGQAGQIYNVCSGEERTLRAMIESMARISGVSLEIQVDQSRLRPNEQRRVVGDSGLLRAHTGWKPEDAMENILKDILDYWEKHAS